MIRITTLCLVLLAFKIVSAQSYHEQFKGLYKEKDTSKIRILLAEWEKTTPNDPELYTSAFNYYYYISRQEIISLDNTQHGDESLQLSDSNGNIAGYLSARQGYHPGNLKKAFEYINSGIEKFPDRLDMRFGKCYLLGVIQDYSPFTSEIIKSVEYSVVIKNKWLWSESKPLDDAENFMLGSVQSYLKQLYDTEDDRLLDNMMQIGDATLKHYPDNIEILSTTAVANLLTNHYDKAITYLSHAEKLNPEDFIVLSNLAHAYKLNGDKKNAIKYYELSAKYGDEQSKENARIEIEKLQKK